MDDTLRVYVDIVKEDCELIKKFIRDEELTGFYGGKATIKSVVRDIVHGFVEANLRKSKRNDVVMKNENGSV